MKNQVGIFSLLPQRIVWSSLVIGLIAGCSLPRHPPETRSVQINMPAELFHEKMIHFRKKFIEVTVCAKLPAIKVQSYDSKPITVEQSLWDNYWLNPEINQWNIRTTIKRNDSAFADFISLPTTKKADIKGDLNDPLVCRIVWGGDIPAGIYEMKISMLKIDTALSRYPGEIRIYTPYYFN